MKIDGTASGSITIDGETYSHDVLIRLSGKVEKHVDADDPRSLGCVLIGSPAIARAWRLDRESVADPSRGQLAPVSTPLNN
jgi:hypothetical protein